MRFTLVSGNVLANIIQLSSDPDQISFPEDTVLIGVLPFFHIYGMVVILNLGLVFGAKTVTMPKFDPGMFLKLLKVGFYSYFTRCCCVRVLHYGNRPPL